MDQVSGARRATAMLVGAAIIAATGAIAVSAEPLDQNDPALRSATPAEIQILRSEQRRIDFQQRQQNLREQDRIRAGAPQPRLNVPILLPKLPPPTFGNSYAR